ncbi:MAG TPA: TIGR01777 family protein [Rikenellaceae bacterium]|nr:MAG: TIGR01777 family protein [Bacteroidetes bacterium GWE2_40_15]HBZ25965.1 TIGR01777 family protein [Rikenellaceae bacterium]
MGDFKLVTGVLVGITGSSGFIGTNLVRHLKDCGYTIMPLKRGFSLELAGKCDIIINLSGASINRRWSNNYKEILKRSRIETTRRVVDAIKMSKKVKLLISVSAVGIYQYDNGFTNTEIDAVYGEDFLANLCKEWEKEAFNAQSCARVVVARLGLVISESGGALAKMRLPAKFGIAATLGRGTQMISWIMIEDLLRAFSHIISNESLSGVVNMTTPYPISNREMTEIIAKKERSLFNIRVPESILRLLMGEASIVITKGQKVIPQKLEKAGFIFNQPTFSI